MIDTLTEMVSRESKEAGLPERFDANTPRNIEILLRHLEHQSVEEIAKYFDLTTQTIRCVLKSPLIVRERERLLKLIADNGVKERIKTLAPEAVDTVRDTMRGANKSELKLKAANSLLDRHPEIAAKSTDEGKFAQGLGESVIRAIGKKLAERVVPTKQERDVSHEAQANDNV